jgi:ribosomal protein S18 acetylase RimI-like enzyme
MWQIRSAEDADRGAVERLWENTDLGPCGDDEWHALTAGHGAILLLAEEGGMPIGTAVASFDGWRAFIYHVAVAPVSRGKGVARALMTEAEALLRRRGARRVYALVSETNTAGIGLCAAMGFEPDGDMAFVKELGAPRAAPAAPVVARPLPA